MNDYVFSRRGLRRGAIEIAPLAVGAVLFGMVFGLLAEQAGMGTVATILMSATVFAGASQFVAVGLWDDPLPWAAIVISTLAVNARHLLMGAALLPWFGRLPKVRAYASLTFMTDENWGLTLRRLRAGWDDLGYLLGGGLVIYVLWVSSTAVGRTAGALLPDPTVYALDYVPLAVFVALLMPFWHGARSLLPWGVAAGVALLVQPWVGSGLPVLFGALAGSLAGAWWEGRRERG